MKKRNYKSLLAVVALSVLLTGCDSASVKLKNQDEAVVVDKTGTKIDVEANTVKEIFDTIKNGSSFASDISSMLVEALAESYIGNFKINSDGELAIEGLDLSDDNSVFEFVKSHKFYWNWKSTGVSVVYEDEPSMSNIEDYRTRIKNYMSLVEREIVKSMFDKANVSDYKKNNKFYEVLFARNIYSSLYSIYKKDLSTVPASVLYTVPDYKNETNKDLSEENDFTFGLLIDATYDANEDYKKIIEGDNAMLHLYHYRDYINETILPGIINNLLTQSYIYDKQYQSIGRTQSRKLNFIKLTDSDSTNAENMLKTYVQDYLSKETESNVDFTPVVEAWYGIHDDLDGNNDNIDDDTRAIAKELAESTFGTESTLIDSKFNSYIDGKLGSDYPYYDGSVYGDLIKQYSKLTNNPSTNDSTAYTTFTSVDGLSVSPEEGLELQIANIRTNSYVTNKWGGSDSFSAISDSTMKNKLFSYGLSSEFETAKSGKYIVDGAYLKQFVKNGPTFLKKTTYKNEFDSVVWKVDSNYYIVEVVDQISPDTLASGSNATKEELQEIESNAIDMGYTLASGSTYTSNAVTYFLKKSNINYYDQSVYDYFKSTYPSLFDD